MNGRLALVATPIGNLGDLSERTRRTLAEADAILAEDTRRARALLSHLGIEKKRIDRFDAAAELRGLEGVLARLERGETLALVTDAGTPGVSDPGAALVRAAAARGVVVSAIPGPSAVVCALAASGFSGSRFRFFGFLPRSGPSRREALAAIAATEEVVVLFESPGRVLATLRELAGRMPSREAVVARELTKLHEELVRGSLAVLGALERRWQGELTIVLGPMEAEREVVDVEARIDALAGEGLRDKDVAKAIALETGMSAGDAYKLVLEKKEEVMTEWLNEADSLVAEGDYEAALTSAAAAYAHSEGIARARAARALAVAHQCLGNLEAAARHADEAASGFVAAGAPNDPEIAEAFHVLAVVHLSAGDLGAASPLLERAARVLEEHGAVHDLASVLLTMAEVAMALGDDEAAEGLYGRILEDVEGSEPESESHAAFLNTLTAKAFLGLGGVAVARDDAAEAKDYLSRAIEFFDAAFGYAHPETIEALEAVAGLYRELGDEAAAAATDEERRVAEAMLAGVEAASRHVTESET